MAKTVAGTTTRYLVDTVNPTGLAQVLEEVSGTTAIRTYSYGLNRISVTQSSQGSQTTSFYGYDGSGHVRFLTDAAGGVTDTYDYDSFGNLLSSSGSTPNAYLFRGERFDSDLGLYYLRARWYNPQTGRFLTMDPAEGYLDNPISLHKYLYALGNPVTMHDPTGYGPIFDTVVRTTAIVTVGAIIYSSVVPFEVPGGPPTIPGWPPGGAAPFVTRYYSPVQADVLCILKTATDADLKSNMILDPYFDLHIQYSAYGCRVAPGVPIPGGPWTPYPNPVPRPPANPPTDPRKPPRLQRPSNCPDPMPEYHVHEFPNYEIWFHRIQALSSGYPSTLTKCSICEPFNRNAVRRYINSQRPALKGIPKEQIDEYPYAATYEGGVFNGFYPYVASVDATQNLSDGGFWRAVVGGLPDGCQVRVIVDP